ncbi:MAG: LapA family protein [Pseudonocardia sp.]
MSDRGDLARPDDVSNDPAQYGNVGPDDPHADPVTEPALRPVDGEDTVGTRPGKKADRTVFSGLYIGLVLAALVLVFLLVFILQNNVPVEIRFLGFAGTLPTGVALLLSAIAGVLLVAVPGSGRIIQLRRAARRAGPKR